MAVTFDGSSFLSTTSLPSGLNQNSAAFTVSMWVYATAFGGNVVNPAPTASFIAVVGAGTTSFDDYIGIATYQGDSVLYFDLSVNNYTENMNVAGPVYGLNAWHHVAMTFSGSTILGYLDGTQYTSGFGSVPSTAIAWTRFLIGGFVGTAQDAWLFNRVLSAAEITSLRLCRMPTISRSSVVGHWPLANGGSATVDWSGNGRTLTATGTVTDSTIVPPQTMWTNGPASLNSI